MYILAGYTDIFIKFMQSLDKNRVERCRLQRVSTTCCSAVYISGRCLHISPLIIVVLALDTVALPAGLPLTSGALKSSAASLTCHGFSFHLHFLLLSFGGIANTFLSVLEQSRVIHVDPFYPYWRFDDMSPSHYLNCGPDKRKLCSLTIYILSFR